MTSTRTLDGIVSVQAVDDDTPAARSRTDRWHQDEWMLGTLAAPVDALLDIGQAFPVAWAPAPRRGVFLADPFPLGDGEVLCEEFTYRRASARLVRARLDGSALSDVRPVHCAVEHVSYPFVIHHDGAVHVVPERSHDGGVHLYRLDDDHLHHVACLVPDVAALDTTIVRHDGRWYAFAGHGGALGPELLIWHADDLLGPWTVHPSSPRGGAGPVQRPAGPLLQIGGRLIRPSQDCTGTYGRRVLLNEVTALSGTDFEETPVAALAVTGGPISRGLHTLVADGDGFLVDGKTRRLRADALVGRVARRVRRARAG
jgi:hypothetical protein